MTIRPKLKCDCGGNIVEDGVDKRDNIPQYKCSVCGKRIYNEVDL